MTQIAVDSSGLPIMEQLLQCRLLPAACCLLPAACPTYILFYDHYLFLDT
jgi:hypothetical protein